MQIENIEDVLAAARPRLRRRAHQYGVASEAVDDIVQETLIEAWRHFNTLRVPERFDAWLDGICRHMCLRWYEHQQKHRRYLANTAIGYSDEPFEANQQTVEDIVDPQTCDPLEELDRQDLHALLDRALGYLPEATRRLVELCYLAELPQGEVALQLGLTINVLEARLHRARKRLRQILNTQMRTEAQEFGLLPAEEAPDIWRPSRQWCWYCGQQRLQGAFESLPGGLINFHMQCPACGDVVGTGGIPDMQGARSFRPALKRLWQTLQSLSGDLEQGRSFCPVCGESRPARVLHPNELAAAYPDSPNIAARRSTLIIDCTACNIHVDTTVDSCLASLPVMQRFMEQHPRCVIEPERLVEYDGQTAICFRLVDLLSAAQLILLVHHRTLRILAIDQT